MILYEYSNYLSTKYSNSTKETYLENVNLFLKFLKEYSGKENSNIQILNISKSDLFNYIAYIDNLSKGTKKVKLYSIKNFYTFLNRDISDFLFKDIKLFNTGVKMPKYLFTGQITPYMQFYTNERDKMLVYLFLNTGIRLSEMANLKIEDFNFIENYFIVLGKGKKYRKVFFSQKCKEKLLKFIQGKQGSLFNLNKRQIQYIIKKGMTACNINGSVHSLRHTFATTMYKQTKDILLVKELLGHTSVVSTQIYTHIDNEEIRKAVDNNPLNREV